MKSLEELAGQFFPHRALAVRIKDSAGALVMAYRDDIQDIWLVYHPFSFTEATFMTDEELAEVAEGVNN